ncbi:methyltransferase domain-containing protein [Fibrella sp. HMF5335]|uniref:Methyltransferase domain-containing protein n=1 Tax=Fibrella rubiginis TaxID=2817060 RepID=A0A939K3B7_9BACT|nr:class I SAM-dependent methyltransferase [Fibrella rubiginis]MBO0934961.1 methyltransferase domain-containing protein [Fibrella rubiginis]
MNAVDFHSGIAAAFSERYQQSPDFQERYRIWTALLDTYIQPGQHVLDAGCGTGVFSHYLAGRGCSVTGIDGSPEMIRRCQAQGGASATFSVAMLPLTHLPETALFDAIISSSVLEYVPDLSQTLRSFDQHLRPGGYLLLSLPNRQSAYRLVERLGYRLTGQPPYLQHVLHYGTATSLSHQLGAYTYQLLTQQTFGGTNAVARLMRFCLPATFSDTLFVAVFQKK